jgi:hypothetical protein
MPITRLLTVRQWTEQHPWPPLGGLRNLIFNSESNGFDAVVRRVGRRVLIDEAAFFGWVERQRVRDEIDSSRPRSRASTGRSA